MEDPINEGYVTVLVIEDQEIVMETVVAMLAKIGYRVLRAKTGAEAVEVATTYDGDIDLSLLDVKLPDMDGGQIYPLIMEARPDQKVIVCSGYEADGPAREILEAGAEGFVQKPFSLEDLQNKIGEVLAR